MEASSNEVSFRKLSMDFVEKKKQIADRVISRSESGLYFLEKFLRNERGGTDPAYSRSIFIILSYSFELILKSLLVLNSESLNIKELDKELRSNLHDFDKISKKLKSELLNIGISNIKLTKQKSFLEYIVEITDTSKILVQDFTNVRYDFMSDDLRNIEQDEVYRIKGEIKSLLMILKNIRQKYAIIKGYSANSKILINRTT